MRKIAIGVVIVAVAIFAFLYVQLYRAQSLISERLSQQGVQAQAVNLSLFPPALSVDHLRTAQFSAHLAEARLQFFPLLYGEVQLSALNFQQIKLSDNAQNSADVSMKLSPFSIKQLLAKKVRLSGENDIHIELSKPLYGKNKSFHFTFNQANIDWAQPQSVLIQFVEASLNHQPIGYIETHANFASPTKKLTAYMQPQCTNGCLAVLKYQQIGAQSAVNIEGVSFPIKRLFNLLNFPETLTGQTDFNIRLMLTDSALTQGSLNFNAQNGQIIGVNLLEIVASRLPINYNSDLLQNKELSTRFEKFNLQLSLTPNLLTANNIELKMPELVGQGTGVVDLNHMQCDMNLTLRSTDERYQKLALPIRFFGDCQSPQYKVNFTKEFRRQIIDLLKEKFH